MKITLGSILFLLIVAGGVAFHFKENIRRDMVHQTVPMADGKNFAILDQWVDYNSDYKGYLLRVLCTGSAPQIDYRLDNYYATISPVDDTHFMIFVPLGKDKPFLGQTLSIPLGKQEGISPLVMRMWPNPRPGYNRQEYALVAYP